MTLNHTLGLLIISGYLSFLGLCQTNQERANERANAGALKLIEIIPRYGGDSTLDKEDFQLEDGEEPTYFIGVAALVVPPLVLVLLSIALCPLWTLCRCCKCCCCKKKKPKEQITKCQIYTPYFIVFACVIAIVAMAGIAYGANVDFSGALLYNEGEGEDGNLFGVAEELMSDGVAKMNSIRNITIDIHDSIVFAVDGVQDILSDTSILSVGTSSLISMLYSISSLWSNYTITTTYNGEPYDFECEFCTTFGETINDITVEIDDQVGPVFADLNDTVNEIESSLVEAEADILEQVNDFVSQITDVRDDLADLEQDVVDTRPDIEQYNDQRELAYNIIFAIPLLPIIFILFGGVLKKPFCFTLSYIFLWFSCTLMWLLLAIHLPIAVLLNDSCDFMDVVDSNVTAVFNDTAGEMFQACLTNEKLTETLGLGGSLNFSETIEFPSLGNITEEFQFGDLIAFENDAFNTNFTTFYQNGDAALVTINNLTVSSPRTIPNGLPTGFGRNNISALNSSAYYTFNTTLQITLESLKNLLLAEAASITAFNDTVYKIRANISSVTDQVSVIEGDVQELADNVDNASVLLNPLFDSVDDMIDTARCGFIGEAYMDTKAVMCSAVLGSLSRIVVAMFTIAILSLFACCWSIKLVRKVEWWQVQKKEEKEQKLQQSFQPNKPTIVVMQPNHNQYQPGYAL